MREREGCKNREKGGIERDGGRELGKGTQIEGGRERGKDGGIKKGKERETEGVIEREGRIERERVCKGRRETKGYKHKHKGREGREEGGGDGDIKIKGGREGGNDVEGLEKEKVVGREREGIE